MITTLSKIKNDCSSYLSSKAEYDIASSIVVALVAIPLCLGVALASGVPLFSGLIAGVIGGIVVGILSQSSVSVSGPATGLIAVVVAAIAQLGSFNAFLLALLIAGIIQIFIGLLRAGFIADYIPSNVVQGLLCAIGILIIVKQLPFAFGYITEGEVLFDSPVLPYPEVLPDQSMTHPLQHIHLGATIISVLSMLILVFWHRVSFMNLKKLPAPIVVVMAGILINYIYNYVFPGLYLSSTNHLVNIPVIKSLGDVPSLFAFPDFSQWNNANVYITALTIAAVASIETLLNLEAAEKIDIHKRYSNRNREMFAQGIGNALAGLFGGLPITSVVVRSSVNIESGARTKLSTIFHGTILLISALLLPGVMNSIPLASLATILIYTGYKLSSIKIYKAMYELGFVHFFPFIVTAIAIIFTGLIQGILIGLATAFFFILKYNSQKCFDIVEERYPNGTVLRLILPQQTTFLNKAAFISELRALPEGSKIILDAHNTDYIDYDIVEIIKDFSEVRAPEKNISMNLCGVKNHYDLDERFDFVVATTYDVQSSLTPKMILDIFIEGNRRFVHNQPIHRDFQQQIEATSHGQHPIAVVLGCIDSRVPIEVVFDLGLGDIFCARVAGNVADDDIMGSIEFACKIAGAKLIVVMGHKECGAIKAACDNVKLGHLTSVMRKIDVAVQAEIATKTERDSRNSAFVTNVAKINIQQTQRDLYNNSPILRELIDKDEVWLIGGYYDVETGEVEFEHLFNANKP